MKKLTSYLYRIIYIFSAVITIGSFTFANLTAVSPTHNGGGNGNIGLLGFFFLFPFIIIFVAMTISYLHGYMYRKLKRNSIRIITSGSLLGMILIISITLIRAFNLKSVLAEVNPIYRGRMDIPLFTIYSNAVFFNFFTFVLLLLICFFISGLMTFKKN
ncbi:hypothetical protein [Rummeliibacillus stabekisii]|uniref:hypothetical protein n=1 Tax=Rummeliibacillus stabekisii TaxID=241244 RepID=UPI00371E9888